MAKKNDVNLEIDEFNLEDLLILGEDKKIPVIIEFPKGDGSTVKAKALVKQLTMKEIDNIRLDRNDVAATNFKILQKAFFKSTGDKFSHEELECLPLGVVNAVTEKIMELSGVNTDINNELMDF